CPFAYRCRISATTDRLDPGGLRHRLRLDSTSLAQIDFGCTLSGGRTKDPEIQPSTIHRSARARGAPTLPSRLAAVRPIRSAAGRSARWQGRLPAMRSAIVIRSPPAGRALVEPKPTRRSRHSEPRSDEFVFPSIGPPWNPCKREQPSVESKQACEDVGWVEHAACRRNSSREFTSWM